MSSADILARAHVRALLTGEPFETLVEAVQKAEIKSFLADCEERRLTPPGSAPSTAEHQ